jgi:hypothetical protein
VIPDKKPAKSYKDVQREMQEKKDMPVKPKPKPKKA